MTQNRGKKPTQIDSSSDRFMQSLRQTLEHVDDGDWLNKRSPLASAFFAGISMDPARKRQVVLTGIKEIDERLRSTWHQWEARAKSPLQSAIWEAVCHLPPDLESYSQAILLLTYFEEPRPRQSEVIQSLALGRSTYYRYLDRACETLGEKLVQLLRPALRLELPAVRPLVGRESQLAQAHQGLQQGKVVHLLGGGGVGKTSLGAQLAANWRGSVFWYTFRNGLTDHLDQLIFSLAYFFHQQGASGLWLHLSTNPQEISGSKVLAALRQHLLDLSTSPPLLCFDEVDLLLASDLYDNDEHARLRSFFEDLSHSPRAGAPLLLIGQKLLLEPEPDYLMALSPLNGQDVQTLLTKSKITLDATQQTRLLHFTRGNPLLLRLFIALYQREKNLAETLRQLSTPLALDWFMARLRLHLAPPEVEILYQLAVYEGAAPHNLWRNSQRALRTLIDLGLVESPSQESVMLHPAIKAWLYQQLPLDRRSELHLAAAGALAERSRFTLAAHHYIQAGQPAIALWSWYTHRQEEIAQGQSRAALEMFSPLAQTHLPNVEDQRVLALLLAQLSGFAGQSQAGLAALDRSTWQASSPSAVQAQQLRAQLIADQGEIERALAEYRRSLESVRALRSTQEIEVRKLISRRALWHLHDLPQARAEASKAQLDLELLQGEIEDMAGNYQAARAHYSAALALAADHATDHQRAKLHEVLGILEARYAHLEAAVEHIEASGHYYEAAGNYVCAVGVANTNLSYAYLVKRQYEAAIPPARKALAFFGEVNHPYWLALNEANLAEAHFYLEEIEQAEHFAQQGLRREEAFARPYCFYVLGHIRRVQSRFAESEAYCRQAINAAEEIQDLWGLAPSWRALGETYRDMGRQVEAQAAFTEALQIFEKLGMAQEVEVMKKMALWEFKG